MFKRFLFGAKRKENGELMKVVSSANAQRLPFYVKAPMVLLGLYLLFNIMLLLQKVLVPIAFAVLIAILLNPLANKLTLKKVPRPLSIALSLLLAVVLFGSLMFFLTTQLGHFIELAPNLKDRSAELLGSVHNWIEQRFGVAAERQQELLANGLDRLKALAGTVLAAVLGALSTFILLPIYVFLILYYKPLFINFFYEVFDYKHGKQVSEVLTQTKTAIQSYILGLVIEMCIIATLNSTALLLIGVKYAVLLGVIGAILNLIPYIGGIIAIALPVAISLATADTVSFHTPLLILVAYTIIQFIDNNILVPRIVSSQVKVNALISIIIVLLGGALWGVAGMFLAIPFVAILKIIFDRVEELQPWGMLLGSHMNPKFSLHDIGTKEAEEKSALNESAATEDVSLEDLKSNEEEKEEEKSPE